MAIPPLPQLPADAVSDHQCEKCGHRMAIRRSRDGHWFYGCLRWPDCNFTFDADQETGAPIVHTRHGIPFRPARKEGAGAFFTAVKRNGFDPEAGSRLKHAQETALAKRRRALKYMKQEQVEARIGIAAPKTPEEWLEFVLSERQVAVQEYRAEALRQSTRVSKLGRPRAQAR